MVRIESAHGYSRDINGVILTAFYGNGGFRIIDRINECDALFFDDTVKILVEGGFLSNDEFMSLMDVCTVLDSFKVKYFLYIGFSLIDQTGLSKSYISSSVSGVDAYIMAIMNHRKNGYLEKVSFFDPRFDFSGSMAGKDRWSAADRRAVCNVVPKEIISKITDDYEDGLNIVFSSSSVFNSYYGIIRKKRNFGIMVLGDDGNLVVDYVNKDARNFLVIDHVCDNVTRFEKIRKLIDKYDPAKVVLYASNITLLFGLDDLVCNFDMIYCSDFFQEIKHEKVRQFHG